MQISLIQDCGIEFSRGLVLLQGNMLLTRDQKHVKLADFGLAREETKGFMTCEAGTYRWMAPEVIVSNRFQSLSTGYHKLRCLDWLISDIQP